MSEDLPIVISIVFGTLILLSLAVFILFSVLKYRKAQTEYSEELLLTRITVRDETLKFISEELHDDVGQLLSLGKIHAHQIVEEYPNDNNVSQILELIGDSLEKVRGISHVLNTSGENNEGIMEILRSEKRKIEALGDIKVEISRDESVEFALENEQILIVHRIIQESVNNILKHANAKNIKFEIVGSSNKRSIVISDDGIGYDLIAIGSGGIGLKNMRSRAKLLRGEIKIDSSRFEGTRVILSIPNKT